MAWLRVIEGNRPGVTYLLDRHPRTAGRGRENRICLEDTLASRMHARFEWNGQTHCLFDLGSKNGTLVNHQPCEACHVLEDGDRIEIGSHTMVYESRGRPGYRDEGLVSTGWLEVIDGPNSGATYHLGERTCTAGREHGNAIQLIDDDISRRHAQFKWTGEHYEIIDLSSTNGLRVNGKRCTEQRLADGDYIRLGGFVLVYRAKGQRHYVDACLGPKRVSPRLSEERTLVGSVEELPALELADPAHSSLEIELDEDPSESSIELDIEISGTEISSLEIDLDILYAASEASIDLNMQIEEVPTPPAPRSALLGRARSARERIEAELRSGSTLSAFLEASLDEVEAVLESDRLAFLSFSGATLVLREQRLRGEGLRLDESTELFQLAIRYVVRHKRAVRKNELRATAPSPTVINSVLCAPVLSLHVDYGVLYADNLGANTTAFDSDALAFLRAAGDLLAAGISHRVRR